MATKIFGYFYATGDSKYHIKPVAGPKYSLELDGVTRGTFSDAKTAALHASGELAAGSYPQRVVDNAKDTDRWDRYFAAGIEVG